MPRSKIVAAVSHHMEKGFIGLDNATIKIPDEDPDDVGIDQASNLRLAFLEIAVETGVLQRNCRLRRKQVQKCGSIRGERVRGQGVFEIEQPGQSPLLDQREAEDRLGLSVAQIIVFGEEAPRAGTLENN